MASGTKHEIDFNAIYPSKMCGEFKIIEEVEPKRYPSGVLKRVIKIQFIKTGTIVITELLSALKGSVMDPYYPTVKGIGCKGNLIGITYTKKEYDMWFTMLSRCYDPNNDSYHNYGAIGVTVDPRWHCFENFMKDLPKLPGYQNYMIDPNKSKYQLDKDYLQQHIPKNQRIYGPNTCVLITNQMNQSARTIDYHNEHNCSSQFYGVYRNSNGTFQANIMYNGQRIFIGTFSSEIAAANAYNYYAAQYGYATNCVVYMSPFEWLQYSSASKRCVQMVHVVQ